jgi:hypothetical protein
MPVIRSLFCVAAFFAIALAWVRQLAGLLLLLLLLVPAPNTNGYLTRCDGAINPTGL